jgi:hypothetical protein
MVEKIRKQADELGITKLRKTVLYGHPTHTRRTFGRVVPDFDREMRNYLSQFDPTIIEGRSGGTRSHTYYLLAPQLNIYIEDTTKLTGWADKNLSHALRITIYTDSEEYLRKIANFLNSLWGYKLLENILWKKIEKHYKVKKEECISTWKELLQ